MSWSAAVSRTNRHEIVAFAGMEADLTAGVLRRGGDRVPLQDKVFRLLAILLRQPGEIISREELRRQLWPQGTYVDFDHNINNAMTKLRRTLEAAGADGGGGCGLIVTHGRQGYSFAGEVRTLREDHTGQASVGNGRVKLAVLPLAALDGGADEEHLAAGVTEALIEGIGAHAPSRLGVIARTTVLRYAGTLRSVAQIGRELRVPLVLEGTVQVLGGRAHISLQLIQVSDQTQIWSAHYDYAATDLLRIQESVADSCVASLAEVALKDAVTVKG
jgi:TolB-like protein